MPFEAGSPAYKTAAQYATTTATARIQETNHFVLVSASEIQRLQQSGQSIEGYVDALFTGQITNIGSQITSTSTKTSSGTYTRYTIVVEVHFNYSFTRARDGSLIGPINRKGSTRQSASSSGALPSVDTLAARIIDEELQLLGQDVAPYIIQIDRELEKESSKELRPQMDAAVAHVKNGNYKSALDTYIAVYNTHKSVAAAINASILYEALGETQTAANFMQNVVAETGNPKARDALARLNQELSEMAGTVEYGDTRSHTNRVTGHVNQEMLRILPANPRVWIHNNTLNDHGMMHDQNIVNDVIDDLTASFIRNGVTVIDRGSIALIMSERDIQMSGFVSDNDFVNISNLAGANTVIIVNVTGVGAMRRLQVRVLDIERGVPIYQSDTSEIWRL